MSPTSKIWVACSVQLFVTTNPWATGTCLMSRTWDPCFTVAMPLIKIYPNGMFPVSKTFITFSTKTFSLILTCPNGTWSAPKIRLECFATPRPLTLIFLHGTCRESPTWIKCLPMPRLLIKTCQAGTWKACTTLAWCFIEPFPFLRTFAPGVPGSARDLKMSLTCSWKLLVLFRQTPIARLHLLDRFASAATKQKMRHTVASFRKKCHDLVWTSYDSRFPCMLIIHSNY